MNIKQLQKQPLVTHTSEQPNPNIFIEHQHNSKVNSRANSPTLKASKPASPKDNPGGVKVGGSTKEAPKLLIELKITE
jgi:hypothetical protein